MTLPTPSSARVFARSARHEMRYVASALRTETVGGALLLGAALLALVWANSPWSESYLALRDTKLGVPGIGPTLSLGHWASDGMLALFFLVAGIELKREFVAGDLSDRAKAAVPVAAALAGVLVPAGLYAVTVTVMGDASALAGWAIPTATDIAFALAVLAVVGRNLPPALRAFLLTLAVVDDLVAITIIALFYSGDVSLALVLGALVPVAVFGWLLRRGITHPLLLALPALAAWWLVQAGGVHATVAGVLLGLAVPVDRVDEHEAAQDDEVSTLAESLEHGLRPWSAGLAVPIFAFFAAGVRVDGSGLAAAVSDAAVLGIVLGLVVGKAVGVFAGTWSVARFTSARLDDELAWWDVLGVALLSGVGFTVSLLIGELAFGTGSARDDHVKVAVLAGSLLSAAFAAVVLRLRDRHHRRSAATDATT